ncbi:unnamed protein product [Linum trigynum]|uniref:E3 ubiquitin-protein ligase LIN n=1 Tax=Linum trigynum TaxID=586398 RepID=A0AAV2FEN3_9ROSI
MASLQQLLAEEGFKRSSSSSRKQKQGSFRKTVDDPVFNFKSPVYICHVEKSVKPNRTSENISSRTRKASIDSTGGGEPAMDQIAVKAIVSILSGYIGRYTKDAAFRQRVREKCNSCLVGKSNYPILTNMELAVQNVDELVQNRAMVKKKELLSNSIQLLTIVSSLNSEKLRKQSTAGIPNSHLSSCAQLYLSIVYKLEKNDRMSAIHLLQSFCDAPLLARTHLLPDLWDHFFLPHLLHLRVWYHEELQLVSSSQSSEKCLKSLCRVYNHSMDFGTRQFALYYKDWLKIGVKSPSVPDVPLPASKPRRRSSMDSSDSQLSINRSLFEYVFGRTPPHQLKGEEKEVSPAADSDQDGKFIVSKTKADSGLRTTQDYSCSEMALAASDGLQKLESSKFFSCRSMVAECVVAAADANLALKNNLSSRRNSLDDSHLRSSPLRRPIVEICTSDVLSDCEAAIHEIARTWLNSGGDPVIVDALSKQPVIESMIEILYASQDDEVLELVISLLAELASRKDRNRVTILNYDPQLEIFIKLLKSSSLFLKAATLLYQLKPLAKQMISTEWVALALRVLEFGDQLQVLFTVLCYPHEAALYFLEQLMRGFDEDKNLENSSEVVSLGGLSLLVRRFDIGGVKEREGIAMLMYSCVKAVGSCRDYLAENLSKRFLLQLIALGVRKEQGNRGFAFRLLTELLCLSRRSEIIRLLIQINHGFDDGLNAMHIFLSYLQRASAVDRPLVAAVLLQLDLLEGDPMKHSVYREEAIEALIECLDCERCDSEAQEQTARALLMMGGSFSHDGQSTTTSTEEWLFRGRLDDSIDGSDLNEEEEATIEWQRKLVTVLLNSGGQTFLMALSGAIANGVPKLARTSLFTVSWMHSFGDRKLIPPAHSILLSQHTDKRSPSSLLQNLVRNQECVSMLWTLDKQLLDPLRTLAVGQGTWGREGGLILGHGGHYKLGLVACRLTRSVRRSPTQCELLFAHRRRHRFQLEESYSCDGGG